MTDQPTPPLTEPEPHRVLASEGTRLEQLHAAYPAAKAAADEAATQLKAITDGIKLELSQAAPEGTTKVDLVGGTGPALRLAYVERWTFDSKKLKADNPLLYVTYAKKGGAWTLKAVRDNGGEE